MWFVELTSVRPTGSASSTTPVPDDPEELAAVLANHPNICNVRTQPLEIGELDAIVVDFESYGMSELTAFALTEGGAAYGFPDGEGRLLLLSNETSAVMISVEGGQNRDAAWSIAGPLVLSVGRAA